VGNLALNCSEIRLSEIFTEVLRSLQRQIDEKKQLFTWHLPNDGPSVWADPSRLSQILMNLISNATKYTLEGGTIFIGAELMPLDPENSERVHVWVQDHGIGIPNEDQKKIFQQYFRTDAAKEMASGTGLGLNITRSLVELQGGEIWFESEPGEGTTFHFTLPVYHPEVSIPKDSEKSS
jgi:signal transduction histidine kinase